jgi:MFS family permease
MHFKDKIQLVFLDNKWIIYMIGLLIGVAMGIINPLASTHLKENNVGSLWIGIISSSFFLAMSMGSMFINKKLRNKGIKETIFIGGVIAAVATIIFPLESNLFILLLLMLIIGFGIGLNMVGIQTILQELIKEEIRGVISGVYSLSFAIGFVFSSVSGTVLYETKPWIPFMIAMVALLLCPMVVNFSFKEKLLFPVMLKGNMHRKISVGLQGAFLYGVTETTLTTLYPVFLIYQGYGVQDTGYALGVFVVGSILGTIPITYLSDKLGRERVLLLSIFTSIFTILGISIFSNFTLRLIFSFLSGFIIGPLYPVALAVSIQKLNKEEIALGTSLFTSFYGVGSTIGPLISSIAMSLLGDDHIFTVCLLLFSIFIFITFIKRIKNKTEVLS